jgi:hypothetical protein
MGKRGSILNEQEKQVTETERPFSQEKVAISEAIARQIISGQSADKELTKKLIKGLCEEYHEVRQRGLTGEGKGPVA